MRIYKRGEFWWCSFPWQGRTFRRSTRCTTRVAALLVAQRWERERADPDHAAAASATFGGAVSAFLAALERTEKPASTKRFYRQKAGVLVRLLGAELPLREVTAARVDRLIAEREREGVAFDDAGAPTRFVTANTIHKELVALRQVLKHARRRGEFRRDPSEVLPVGFSPRYEPRRLALTPDQARALLGELGPARTAFVAFVVATGARRGEAVAQLRADVDLETGIVRLRGTKTEGADRVVAVPPFARPLLAFAVEHGAGDSGFLLRPWPNVLRGLARACRRIGAPRVTPNDLRRTLATWLVEGGVSTYAVSKVLGHASTAMVERVYGKPREAVIGDLVARQTAALPPVRVVYTGETVPALPEQNASDASTEDS